MDAGSVVFGLCTDAKNIFKNCPSFPPVMVTGNERYAELLSSFEHKADALGLVRESYGTISYPGAEYRLLKLTLDGGDGFVVITTGFHGDEIAGPLSILEHLEEIVGYARQCGVGLVIYPCTNPSGFDGRTRYNADEERGNNDFLRYLKGGIWTDDLKNSTEHDGWRWSSDPSLGQILPLETRLLHEDMRQLPFESVRAIIDLHQDHFLEGPSSYAYVFGEGTEYVSIVEEVEKRVQLLRNTAINSGQSPGCPPDEIPVSDEHGFIRRHDGTVTDLFHRLGVPYSVAVETTGDTELGAAMDVDLIWVKGILRLAGKLNL